MVRQNGGDSIPVRLGQSPGLHTPDTPSATSAESVSHVQTITRGQLEHGICYVCDYSYKESGNVQIVAKYFYNGTKPKPE